MTPFAVCAGANDFCAECNKVCLMLLEAFNFGWTNESEVARIKEKNSPKTRTDKDVISHRVLFIFINIITQACFGELAFCVRRNVFETWRRLVDGNHSCIIFVPFEFSILVLFRRGAEMNLRMILLRRLKRKVGKVFSLETWRLGYCVSKQGCLLMQLSCNKKPRFDCSVYVRRR